MLATATASPTPSKQATPPVLTVSPGPQRRGSLTVLPNPVRGAMATFYPPDYWGTSNATLEVYSVAYTKMFQLEFPNMAWHPIQVDFHEHWNGRLAPGLYYVVFKTEKLSAVAKMLILE
jgi:hypothetical protein